MTIWLEQKEKMVRHKKYIQWHLNGCQEKPRVDWISLGLDQHQVLKMTKHPSAASVPIEWLETQYGVRDFWAALAQFVTLTNYPQITCQYLEYWINNVNLSAQHLLVWNTIKYLHVDHVVGEFITADSGHCQPQHESKRGDIIMTPSLWEMELELRLESKDGTLLRFVWCFLYQKEWDRNYSNQASLPQNTLHMWNGSHLSCENQNTTMDFTRFHTHWPWWKSSCIHHFSGQHILQCTSLTKVQTSDFCFLD